MSWLICYWSWRYWSRRWILSRERCWLICNWSWRHWSWCRVFSRNMSWLIRYWSWRHWSRRWIICRQHCWVECRRDSCQLFFTIVLTNVSTATSSNATLIRFEATNRCAFEPSIIRITTAATAIPTMRA